MTSWDYRFVRRVVDEEETVHIHEVYYDEAGRITMWSQESVAPQGEDPDGLVADLELMAEAAEKPVLDHAELPGALGFGSDHGR